MIPKNIHTHTTGSTLEFRGRGSSDWNSEGMGGGGVFRTGFQRCGLGGSDLDFQKGKTGRVSLGSARKRKQKNKIVSK